MSHTFLCCESRWPSDIGIVWGIPGGLFRLVVCSLLPFIPEVEGQERRQVRRSICTLDTHSAEDVIAISKPTSRLRGGE